MLKSILVRMRYGPGYKNLVNRRSRSLPDDSADLTGFVRWRAALALLKENRRDGPLSFAAQDPRKRMAIGLAPVFRVVPSAQVLPGS